MNKSGGYHILLIEVVNNRSIKVFRAKVNGGHLEVAGPTGTGKTTAISALWEIIAPGQDRIRHGEDSSDVKIRLSDGKRKITAKRHYTPSGSTVTITDDEGESISAKDFKEMISVLSSNPHKIESMKNSDKIKLLLQSAGITPEQYEALDAAIDKTKDSLSEAIMIHKQTTPGDEPEKVGRVSTEDLQAEIRKMNEHNEHCDRLDQEARDAANKYDMALRNKESASEEVDRAMQCVEDLERELQEARESLESSEEALQEATHDLTQAGSAKKKTEKASKEAKRIDYSEIAAVIDRSNHANDKAAAYEAWMKQVKAHEEATGKLGEAKSKHSAAIKAKREFIDGAKFPLPGLSIEDGNLVYNGNLVDNLGSSEQTLVYASLAFEDVARCSIKAVRLDGIESMSKEDYETIKAIADEKGIQILSSRVTWDGSVEDNEVLIVDGIYGAEEDEGGIEAEEAR